MEKGARSHKGVSIALFNTSIRLMNSRLSLFMQDTQLSARTDDVRSIARIHYIEVIVPP